MDSDEMLTAVHAIVDRNRTDNVREAAFRWAASECRLDLGYYTQSAPTPDDAELCELSLAEILGEFPGIKAASTEQKEGLAPADMQVVYRKKEVR
ncbi:hypothetical protein [Dyella telluris]|uniref:Uncharacterized protein n=1 Tax=Dyella telluris TaxID=2763498 RepID=A0A7G8Q3J6_9GAMM|nr:hypothetical protein [Dyella telluris]QNK01354.1 hypothetical protein H8F01_20315 [Dyella telluris]